MADPSGFELVQRTSGEVVISHHGNVAAVLRGEQADRFSSRVEAADDLSAQHLMARATGNYRRGNERRRLRDRCARRRPSDGSVGEQ